MRSFLLTMLVLALSIASLAQTEIYSRVEIPIEGVTLEKMAKLGLPLDAGYLKKGNTFVGEFSSSGLQKLEQANIPYKTLIDDVSKFYAERSKRVTKSEIRQMAGESDVPVPDGFNLGSMGGFLTYDELLAELDTMAADYPNLITERDPMPGGTSIEGRSLYYVKISDNPNESEDEPQILFTGMHHAREPGGMMVLVFYMYHLLENYDTDPEIQNLVDNTEIYFAPCVNPDGYIYNEENYPNGGGPWRKNRRDNGNGSYGVDLNRNYGYQWGYDNSGSSPNPWDDTYRGTAPFSEPETEIIKEFCESHEFGFAINYHTYSDKLLYTWGYTSEPCEDDALLEAYSAEMTQVNGYEYGPGSTTIYATNGGSDDWMYGEQETKNKIFAFTPEVGGSSEGFWPSPDYIIPQCQENLLMNVLATKYTGKYAELYDKSPAIIESKEDYFHFDIKRFGREDVMTYTVSVEPVTENIESVGDPKDFIGMEIMETRSDSIAFTLTESMLDGDTLSYVLAVDNGDYTSRDTLTKIYGESVIVASDSCNSLQGWSADGWDITDEAYFSAPHSITDSPYGNYENNETSVITLSQHINLENMTYAQLTFQARWEIEAGYDYVQVQVSDNNGISWVPMAGKYTTSGTLNQQEGEPVYDGGQYEWVLEEIPLTQYIGEEIMIRFVLESDQGVTEDGFYFDDVKVNGVQQMFTGVAAKRQFHGQIEVFPNPAMEQITIALKGAKAPRSLKVFDCNGKLLQNEKFIGNRMTISVENMKPGIYYYRVLFENGSKSIVKKVLVQ